MSAILEARETLRVPLARFREAMAGTQTELGTMSLDDDFQGAVQAMSETRIAPALQELEDVARQKRIGALLGRDLLAIRDPVPAEAAISFSTATVAELPGLAALALGVGLDVGASSVYKRRSELKERQNENRLLFLYEARHQAN